MDYLIVGGGISGLYTAYSLHKHLGIKKISLIEKSDRLGGRIYTKYLPDGTVLEMGASRIADTHINVLNLIKELGLSNDLTKPAGGRSYATLKVISNSDDSNPVKYTIENYSPINQTDFYDIMNKLINHLSNPDFYHLAQKYSLHRLIERYYGIDKAILMRNQFGYDDDFLEQNAIDALIMFRDTFKSDGKFRGLAGGLNQIIMKLARYLEDNNIPIRLNTECRNITKENDGYVCLLNGNEKIFAKNIVLAIPKLPLMKIPFLKKIRSKLDDVINKPLIRIYAFFPSINGKIWFDDLNTVITTNTLIRQIIPLNKDKGLIMFYCDGNSAKTWFYLGKDIRPELMIHLRSIFYPKQIPKPTKLYVKYWNAATHIWCPAIDSKKASEEIRKPFPNENIYIVGEAYSLTQQWSEGAVSTINKFIKLIT